MKIFTEQVAKRMIVSAAILFIIVPLLFFWNDRHNLSLSAPLNDSKLSSYGTLLSGLIGTIWSLASVILFYVALTEQRKDMETNRKALELQTEALSNQIKEFELQTKELEATRKVYSDQLATQSLQRFESTFFQMVSLHHNLVNATAVRDERGNAITGGRESFLAINGWLIIKWNKNKDQEGITLIDVYLSLYDSYQHVLGHYFRNLYQIFKFVDESDIVNKRFYANIIRAQLSSNELLLLVYNGLSANGNVKFKPLIETYSIFKNLDWSLIEEGKATIKQYRPEAFGHSSFNFLQSYSGL